MKPRDPNTSANRAARAARGGKAGATRPARHGKAGGPRGRHDRAVRRPESGRPADVAPEPTAPPPSSGQPGVPQLSGTGRVILGMIALGKRTGYDIKQLVDASTRFFWAASYGQIYPELRRLEQQGLVSSRPEPSGSRARTVYELTGPGEAALREWLRAPGEPLYELRDEGFLKLFFSGAAGPSTAPDQLDAIRATHERKLAVLREIEPAARAAPHAGPYLTLQLGMGMSQWIVDWCRATAQGLRESDPGKEGES